MTLVVMHEDGSRRGVRVETFGLLGSGSGSGKLMECGWWDGVCVWWALVGVNGCYWLLLAVGWRRWRGKIQPLRLVSSQAGSMCGDELPIYAKKAH